MRGKTEPTASLKKGILSSSCKIISDLHGSATNLGQTASNNWADKSFNNITTAPMFSIKKNYIFNKINFPYYKIKKGLSHVFWMEPGMNGNEEVQCFLREALNKGQPSRSCPMNTMSLNAERSGKLAASWRTRMMWSEKKDRDRPSREGDDIFFNGRKAHGD